MPCRVSLSLSLEWVVKLKQEERDNFWRAGTLVYDLRLCPETSDGCALASSLTQEKYIDQRVRATYLRSLCHLIAQSMVIWNHEIILKSR